ncbi:MAG: ABC transporter substrate-binding protein [Rhodospirillaceae bacterium]|jgi:phospholipid transport system substrate-binding protein|nr:ABC transporter substrate-binding protein [Rhodospirillaceae bacterium]
MMSRRLIIMVFFGFFLGLAQAPSVLADSHDKQSADFIRSLANRAIDSLTDPDTPRGDRIDRFRNMFNDSFAVRSIGKRALGRYWRRASTEERMQYQKLFEELMVVTYVDRFATYAGEALDIRKTRIEDKAITTVFSEIRRKGGAKPIRVDWIVGTNGTIFKIVDVKVEGVSMTQTLSSDFTSIIRQKDGQVSGLIVELEKKTAQLSAN